jgi:hemerythrin
MPLIEWTADLSVNVVLIDDQHKSLFGLLNQLYSAMKAGKPEQILKPLLDDLVHYAQVHFATEEMYMKQFEFPGYAEHCTEHQAFKERLLGFQSGLSAERFTLSMEIAGFLKNWVHDHISITDKRYSACFNEHGLN